MSTIRCHADIARRSAQALARVARPRNGFRRERFSLPREAAREKAREMFRRFGRLYGRDRVVAGASGRPHRIHGATTSERRLIRTLRFKLASRVPFRTYTRAPYA
jgi:hypothetical protein